MPRPVQPSAVPRRQSEKQEQDRSLKNMAGIRPLIDADVPRVADLIWNVLHGHKGGAPSSLQNYVQDLFLRNPWFDEGIVPRVYEDAQGKIVGFFGAVPRRMTLQGKPIRLAFGSNFVMDPGSRASMAAIQLVRAFMKGPQDISITDSANENSRQLLRSLGFHVVPVYSLQWARPLRPALYAVDTLSRLKKGAAMAAIGSIAKPFCRLADAVATSAGFSPFHQSQSESADENLDTGTLLRCLADIPAKHWMLPEYDQGSLNWLFDFIDKRKALGEIRKAVVSDKGKIVGWYVYGIGSGGMGEVLQIGAASSSVGVVLDHLFYDGWKRGLIGLQGRMEPQFMEELTAKMCFFFRHGSWTLIHSNKPEVITSLQSGTAFFSRLEGEWSLRHGGIAT